jgi:hypothetical protein
VTQPDPDRQSWEVTVFRGLFVEVRCEVVTAKSGFHAECYVESRLSADEWIPTFSAIRCVEQTIGGAPLENNAELALQ